MKLRLTSLRNNLDQNTSVIIIEVVVQVIVSSFVNNIKWIMLVAGLATCSTLSVVFAPQDALMSMFGANLTEPLANVVVRSWGFLVFLMGALLIYGALKPESRKLCIVTAGISKLGFLLLILMFGSDYFEALRVTVIFDSAVIAVLGIYLVASKNTAEVASDTQ